jgi:hypothetical protein
VITAPATTPRAETDREDLLPEPEDLQVHRVASAQVQPVDERQEDRQADGDRRERHMEDDGEGELPSGQFKQRG